MPLTTSSRATFLLAFGAAALGTGGAHADDKSECVEAYEQAQELRLQRQLGAAHDRLLVCSRAVCPKVALEDCRRWLGEVEATMPRVSVGPVQDVRGRDVARAVVRIDGKAFDGWDDGHEVPVDPGRHVVRVEATGKLPSESPIDVREGDRRRVSFVMHDAVAVSRGEELPTSSPRLTVPVAIAGGVGVVGLAGWAVLGLVGKADADSLRNNCYPHCDDASVARANRELLLADVSLGVAVVGVGLAAWFFLHAPAPSSMRASARGLRWSF
jgi:hypothetical protein